MRWWIATLVLMLSLAGRAASAADIVLATTTSAKDSGLLPVLIDKFKGSTGIGVRVLSVGTGQAFEVARRGDADVVLTHDEEQELQFMSGGYGLTRRPVMYNDFVLLGPANDPAKIKGLPILDAMRDLAQKQPRFVTRGDKSGTHAAELRLWKASGLEASTFDSSWYKNVGAGMGAALNTATGMNAYILADRATWLRFSNRGDLRVLVEGSPSLHNRYAVLTLDPKRHPHIKVAEAQAFADWLVSPAAKAAIAAFRIQDQQVFFIP